VDFSRYKGKKVLIVNTASKSIYTPQYEDLQKIQSEYGDKVVILAFPCNQFGGEEPGSSSEIAEFYKKNYRVNFQLFEKIDVAGDNQHPLYKWLSSVSQNGLEDKRVPTWNFCKYFINEKGEVIDFYGSSINPMDAKILDRIKQ
jgi:glutathione peroxidase